MSAPLFGFGNALAGFQGGWQAGEDRQAEKRARGLAERRDQQQFDLGEIQLSEAQKQAKYGEFKRNLDNAMGRLISTQGADVEPLVQVYNSQWPDGNQATIQPVEGGGYQLQFSDGTTTAVKDWQELGRLAASMADPNAYMQAEQQAQQQEIEARQKAALEERKLQNLLKRDEVKYGYDRGLEELRYGYDRGLEGVKSQNALTLADRNNAARLQAARLRQSPREPQPTTLMRELEAAGLQPGTPEYQEALLGIKTKPLVDMGGGKQETKFQETIGKNDADRLIEWEDQAYIAQDTKATLGTLQSLMGEVTTGRWTPAMAKAAAALGLPMAGDAQAFTAATSILVLDLAERLTGVLTDKDIKFLQDASPNLAHDPKANQMIIDMLSRAADRSIARQQAASRWAEERGSLRGFRTEAQPPDGVGAGLATPGSAAPESTAPGGTGLRLPEATGSEAPTSGATGNWGPQSVLVPLPDGTTAEFPNQQAADAFKRDAGIP